MAKKRNKSGSDGTQTSVEGLRTLTALVTDLTQNGAIDARFAKKVLNRVIDEVELLDEPADAQSAPDWKALRAQMAALATQVDHKGAFLLVAANARLREADELAAARARKKDEKAATKADLKVLTPEQRLAAAPRSEAK